MSSMLATREADQIVHVSMLLKDGTSANITEKERDDTNDQVFEALKEVLSDDIISLTLYEGLWDLKLNDIDSYEFAFSAKVHITGDFDTDTDHFSPKEGFLDYGDSKELRTMLKNLPIAKYIDFSTIWIDIDTEHIHYGEYIDFI